MEAWIVVLLTWFLVSLALAVLVGRGIRLADRCDAPRAASLSTADLPTGFSREPAAGRR